MMDVVATEIVLKQNVGSIENKGKNSGQRIRSAVRFSSKPDAFANGLTSTSARASPSPQLCRQTTSKSADFDRRRVLTLE